MPRVMCADSFVARRLVRLIVFVDRGLKPTVGLNPPVRGFDPTGARSGD
jgi:hypothetical protein